MTDAGYPQYVLDAWAEWRAQSRTALIEWDRLTAPQQAQFAAVIEVAVARARAALPAIRRLTVTAGQYSADYRLLGDDWSQDDHGALTVTRDGRKVGEWAAGQWGGILDATYRDPDWLRTARDGLSEILRLIRIAERDHDAAAHTQLAEAIHEAAGKALDASAEEVPF